MKNLIEIVLITDVPEQYEDGSRKVHHFTRRIRCKDETHVKLTDTCKDLGNDM